MLAKRNYKVYADIRVTSSLTRRVMSVLDTGTGPNFIRGSELSLEVEQKIEAGPLHDICDANNNNLLMRGTIKFPVGLGRLLAGSGWKTDELGAFQQSKKRKNAATGVSRRKKIRARISFLSMLTRCRTTSERYHRFSLRMEGA